MNKRILVLLLIALVFSTGSLLAQNSDVDKVLVLTGGAGGYGRFQLTHVFSDFPSFGTGGISNGMIAHYGPAVYLKADIFSFLTLDAMVDYLFYNNITSEASGNYIRAHFSALGQIQRPASDRLTVFPFFGAGYEMNIYSKAKGGTGYWRPDLVSGNDSLYLKLGYGMNYSITEGLRFNLRFAYDIFLLSKNTKIVNSTGGNTSLYLRHAPAIFLGVGYAFLRL